MKKQVAIIMGSKSDMPVMQHCLDTLDKFKADYDVKILSAHRTPKQTAKYAEEAAGKGLKVIIAAAGGAAHLGGVIAAHTTLPVIGVPMDTKPFSGVDSLLSVVQMPKGIPVGCMAVGKAGAINAAIFAVEILALSSEVFAKRIAEHKKQLAEAVLKG
ncbi:MAG: 5-(carboxyamino)imidazole ribonucleotide mutase [Candidatus Omnitrophota bacterium]